MRALEPLLQAPLSGCAWISLQHEKKSAFRWLFLLELPIAGTCLCTCLVLGVVLSVLGSDAATNWDLPDLKLRSRRFWREILVRAYGADRRVLAERRFLPDSADEARRISLQLLRAAGQDAVVVHELIADGAAAHPVETWYGGRPLMASPLGRDERALAEALRRSGYEIAQTDALLELSQRKAPVHAIFAWILLAMVLPIFPFLFLTKSGRTLFKDLTLNIKGAPPERSVIRVDAVGLTVGAEREGEWRSQQSVAKEQVLGITVSPWLGEDRDIRLHEACLRVIADGGDLTLDVPTQMREPIAALLIAAALRLWHGQTPVQPTHCPYCTTLYRMEPGGRCPHCGAPAGMGAGIGAPAASAQGVGP